MTDSLIKRLFKVLFLLTAGLLGLSQTPVVGAGVVGSGTPGSCSAAALSSALSGGGEVTFNCGGAHTITLSSEQTITSDTTIKGGGEITLSGGDATRLFNVQNGATLTLENITLQNGFSSADGGGIYVERLGTAVLTGVTLANSVATNGGGIALNGWGSSDPGGTLIVSDSTFRNNRSTSGALPGGGNGGGALYITGGSTATVSGSTFSDNRSVNGGAIHILGANLSVSDTLFEGNVADNSAGGGGGGAIYVDGTKSFSGLIAVSGSTFRGNHSNQLGGAIFTFLYGSSARVEVDQSLFDGNYGLGVGQGGAFYHQSNGGESALYLRNSTFVGNYAHATDGSASQGGALWSTIAPVTIENSTFVNNDATTPIPMAADNWRRGFGGAIRTSEETTIINSTIVNNTAGFVGGGVAGEATVRNTIIAHNSGDNPWDIQENCTVELTNAGNNIQHPQKTTGNWNDYECFGSQTAVDPLLGSLGDYGGPTPTVPLLAGSPAINAGNNCPTLDQRGFARNGPCDIGAYEFGGGIVITSLSPAWVEQGSGDVTLSVLGAGFTPTSVIRWEGSGLSTTYVAADRLTAVLPAAELDTLGSFAITVYDSGRSLESQPATFSVVAELFPVYLPLVVDD